MDCNCDNKVIINHECVDMTSTPSFTLSVGSSAHSLFTKISEYISKVIGTPKKGSNYTTVYGAIEQSASDSLKKASDTLNILSGVAKKTDLPNDYARVGKSVSTLDGVVEKLQNSIHPNILPFLLNKDIDYPTSVLAGDYIWYRTGRYAIYGSSLASVWVTGFKDTPVTYGIPAEEPEHLFYDDSLGNQHDYEVDEAYYDKIATMESLDEIKEMLTLNNGEVTNELNSLQ